MNVRMMGVAVTGLFLMGATADAKFGIKMPNIPGVGVSESTEATVVGGDLKTMTADVLSQCAEARSLFKGSYAELAETFGMTADAAKIRKEAAKLTCAKVSVKDLKTQAVVDVATASTIDAKMSAAKNITPDQVQHFQSALTMLKKGLAIESSQLTAARELVAKAKAITATATGLDKARALSMVRSAMDLGTLVPSEVQTASATLTKLTSFASANGIKIPATK